MMVMVMMMMMMMRMVMMMVMMMVKWCYAMQNCCQHYVKLMCVAYVYLCVCLCVNVLASVLVSWPHASTISSRSARQLHFATRAGPRCDLCANGATPHKRVTL